MAQIPGQKAQRIDLLRQILWIYLASTLLSWLGVVVQAPGMPLPIFTVGCLAVVGLSAICFALLRRGLLRQAAWLYLICIFGIQVGIILNEGLQVAAVISFIACIFIAGFTLSATSAGWVAASVAPVVIFGRLLEQDGTIPLDPIMTEVMRTSILMSSFLGAGFLAVVALRTQERFHADRLRAELESVAQLERSQALTDFSRDIGTLTSESSLIRKAVEVTHTQRSGALTLFLQARGGEIQARHWSGESIEGLSLDALFARGVEAREEGLVSHTFSLSEGVNRGHWKGLSFTVSGEGEGPFGVLVQLFPLESFERASVVPFLGAVGSIVQGDLARRLQEKRTLQAQRLEAVGRLAGGVAHDFNNHLAAIVGSAEAIQGRLSEDSGHSGATAEDLGRITGASADASQLIQKLLAFARGDEERPVAMDLARTLRAYLERGAHQSCGPATVEWNLPADPVWVLIGPTSAIRILDNLLRNALSATPSDGRIEVRLAVVNQEVILEVEDNGQGMQREMRERAMEPFFNSSNSQGHGLGLSIVHGCVSSAGGEVEIHSEVDVGTKVTVRLPWSDALAPAAPSSETPSSEDSMSLEGMRVVVVDDEENVRTTICSMLETLGATVVADFHSGVAALDWVKNGGSCDVALTDMTMPGMDGIRLVRELRRIDGQLPVVLMTGYARERSGDLRELGITHASKPLRMRDLVACLIEAQGKPRMQAETHP
ncbi:MAG: ATP-binding protein [Myxococcota bacterium]|nr:ATP-binding protein [Myxococcota bacterium]